MLSSLYVENIALIKKLDLELSGNFTVFTGETGAGKSILIDAISLLTGNRRNKELIRTGEEKATVSAIFNCKDEIKKQLEEMGITFDGDNNIFIERYIYTDGRSSAKVNGKPYPLSFLRSVGQILINIHGQHDTPLLLDSRFHTELLDSYSETKGELDEYSKEYEYLSSLRAKIKSMQKEEEEKDSQIILLNRQINEIESAKLKKGEEEELSDKKKRIAGIEKVSKQTRIIMQSLYKNEKGIHAYSLIQNAVNGINEIRDLFPDAEEYIEKLTKMAYDLEDIFLVSSSIVPDIEEDPEDILNSIEERLDVISRLKKKYGDSVEDMMAFADEAKRKLERIKSNAQLLEEYKADFKKHTSILKLKADILTSKRKRGALSLEESVKASLEFLDMPKVRFSVNFGDNAGRYYENGGDVIEFLISANAGEPLKPMAKTSSGGELSRIMLALKAAFREREKTPTLIFDEIDNGVSGKTALKIGIKLKQIADTSQVLCVTHSAQIASLSDSHMKISKYENEHKTETKVDELTASERIDELARIIGGQDITETIRDTARELLKQAENY